jgi:hypothetical protein
VRYLLRITRHQPGAQFGTSGRNTLILFPESLQSVLQFTVCANVKIVRVLSQGHDASSIKDGPIVDS